MSNMIRPAGDSDFDSTDDEEMIDLHDPSATNQDNAEPPSSSSKNVGFLTPQNCSPTTEACNPLIIHDMQTAISTGNVGTVEELLAKVDNPNVLLKSGWPLIVHAAYFCQYTVVKLLIEHGANVNATNDTGDTALHAVCKSSTDSHSESDLKTVKLLVTSGANVDAKDHNGRTPLVYACRRNLTTVVRYIINLGDSTERILCEDERKWNCVDWSAVFGNLESLDILIRALQRKINPDKFWSSKMWPNKVLEFLETFTLDRGSISRKTADVSPQISTDTAMDVDAALQKDMYSGVNAACTPERGDASNISGDTEAGNNDEPNESQGNSKSVNSSGTASPKATACDTHDSNLLQGLMEDEDEQCVLPTVIKKAAEKSDDFHMYGHLELFLAGLDLSHLIPLFQKQDIKFEELLCLSMEELENIGIKAYGTRKRILKAVKECHEKHTSTSQLPDYTKTPLTTDNVFQMLTGSAEQVEYIASCMRYIKYHVEMYPDALYPDAGTTYDKAPLQTYHEKIEGVTKSVVNLAKSLDDLRSHADDFDGQSPPELTQPIGLATLDSLKGGHPKSRRLLAISIAVMAMYVLSKSSLYSGRR